MSALCKELQLLQHSLNPAANTVILQMLFSPFGTQTCCSEPMTSVNLKPNFL